MSDQIQHTVSCPTFVYGSASGLGDYDFIATSERFSDRWRDVIGFLSGTPAIHTPEAHWRDIIAFYPVDDTVHVLSRTRYLGKGRRGPDFLSVGVVLSTDALDARDWLTGELLTEPLFQRTSKERKVDPLLVGPQGQSGALKESVSLASMDTRVIALLSALARNRLALSLPQTDTFDPLEICLSLQRLLPVDDRRRFTFCTRAAYRGPLPYRLGFVRDQDKDLLARALPESVAAGLDDVRAIGAPFFEPMKDWCRDVAPSLPPIRSLSLWDAPATGLRSARVLLARMGYAALTGTVEPRPRHVNDTVLRARMDPDNERYGLASGGPLHVLLDHVRDQFLTIWKSGTPDEWRGLCAGVPELLRTRYPLEPSTGEVIATVQARKQRDEDDRHRQADRVAALAVLMAAGDPGSARMIVGPSGRALLAPDSFWSWLRDLAEPDVDLASTILSDLFAWIGAEAALELVQTVVASLGQSTSFGDRDRNELSLLAACFLQALGGEPEESRRNRFVQFLLIWSRFEPLFDHDAAAKLALQTKCLREEYLDRQLARAIAPGLVHPVQRRPALVEELGRPVALSLAEHCVRRLCTRDGDGPDVTQVNAYICVVATVITPHLRYARLHGARQKHADFFALCDRLVQALADGADEEGGLIDRFIAGAVQNLRSSREAGTMQQHLVPDALIEVLLRWPGRANDPAARDLNRRQQQLTARILLLLLRACERLAKDERGRRYSKQFQGLQGKYREELSRASRGRRIDSPSSLNYLNSILAESRL